MRVKAAVVYFPGTNSHREAAFAFERAGADAEVVMMSSLLAGRDSLDRFGVICLPGGFSYGDHLGAGSVAGLYLRKVLGDGLGVLRSRPVLAICNGFQVAVRSGLFGAGVALRENGCGTFRNIARQPHMVDDTPGTFWLAGLEGQTVRFPCAHGEGRFAAFDTSGWRTVLRYPPGENPDGSQDDIAGIVTADGLAFGLMDHPERAPDDDRAMQVFRNGVEAAS